MQYFVSLLLAIFWAIGAGTLLTKIIDKFDVYASLDAHYSFAREESTGFGRARVRPGMGGNLGLGFGYNTQDFRFGPSLTWTYEDAIDLDGENPIGGSPERFATAALAASYMYSDEWAATLSYADQTWFGSPTNSPLGQSVTLQIQRRWGR